MSALHPKGPVGSPMPRVAPPEPGRAWMVGVHTRPKGRNDHAPSDDGLGERCHDAARMLAAIEREAGQPWSVGIADRRQTSCEAKGKPRHEMTNAAGFPPGHPPQLSPCGGVPARSVGSQKRQYLYDTCQ